MSKRYRLGAREVMYSTLRESLVEAIRSPFNRLRGNGVSDDQTLWALQNLSFDINPGEVVGIIGRNGAGKTTLLKILSRITEPTSGRAELYGRVGSLLEVGTGFHPELTGRENVFLNGAILGMKKTEIESKFDEIVAFAEIEKFLDTPVKRYSSGMYVRLAFAVAAHLNPEILIVDEVLAVGDTAFQKKCLGKMQAVAGEGRTVLFVSHNVGAVQQLCTRAILLDRGSLLLDDVPQKVVSHYLLMGMEMIGERVWPDLDQAPGDDVARLRAVRVLDSQRNICTSFDVRDPVSINMEYSLLQDQDMLEVSLYFYNQRGELLFVAIEDVRPRAAGNYRSTCLIPSDFLNDCQIYVLAGLTDEKKIHTIQRDIVNFSVTDAMDAGGARGTYRAEWPPSAVRPKLEWKVDWIPQTEAAT